MPEMNGFEATEYIRKVMKSKIPIIALTADVTSVDVQKCKLAGMNDYISKPVDEKLLYGKMVGLVKKSILMAQQEAFNAENLTSNKVKYVDLQYLIRRTKANPDIMMEMISLYLEQTPPLVSAMKLSLQNKDWTTLNAAIHKMIPSFSIMGFSPEFELMAKKVQAYANLQNETDNIHDMVSQLENICNQACQELIEELNIIKNNKK